MIIRYLPVSENPNQRRKKGIVANAGIERKACTLGVKNLKSNLLLKRESPSDMPTKIPQAKPTMSLEKVAAKWAKILGSMSLKATNTDSIEGKYRSEI